MNLNRNQLALGAALCAALVLIGCLMDWVSIDIPDAARAAAAQAGISIPSINGFTENVNGTFPFILALLAAGACTLVFLGKTDLVPLDGRQLLFAACGCYALGALLVIVFPFSNVGAGDAPPRAFGLWLTALACLGGAALAFLATTKKPGGKLSADPTPAADNAKSDD